MTLKDLQILSSPSQQPAFQASKWLEIQLLIDSEEMKDLIQTINPIIFRTGFAYNTPPCNLRFDEFIQSYETSIELLKQGKLLTQEERQKQFTLAFTKEISDLYALKISGEKYLIKCARPIIQVLPHRFQYSTIDRKIRSMTLGSDTIEWGIQISFPQLFQNPSTKEIEKTLMNPNHPNGLCFREIQKWVRLHTQTARFQIDKEIIPTTLRLGKRCLSWIHQHPQLIRKNIMIIR